MGRPKKIVDLNVAENLAKKQLLQAEIAAILGITVETLNSRISDEFNETFSEWRTRVCAAGLGKLRESMWDQAVGEKPNTTMQIWLSKQYLGMRDSFEEEKPPIKPVMIVWQDKTIELSSTEIKELPEGETKE